MSDIAAVGEKRVFEPFDKEAMDQRLGRWAIRMEGVICYVYYLFGC